jgi:hypothetical protein
LFEKAIDDEETYERQGANSIHNLLRQNIWLVNQNYQILQDDKTLKNIIYQNWKKPYIGEAAGKRPDFLCMTEQVPQSDQLVIIEIKRPSVPIVFEMFKQVTEYRHILSTHSGQKFENFKCILIGKKIDPIVKENNLSSAGLIVKSYTDFIGEARKFYKEYLKIIEENPQAI